MPKSILLISVKRAGIRIFRIWHTLVVLVLTSLLAIEFAKFVISDFVLSIPAVKQGVANFFFGNVVWSHAGTIIIRNYVPQVLNAVGVFRYTMSVSYDRDDLSGQGLF